MFDSRMGEPGINSTDEEGAEAGVSFREFVRVLAVMKPLNGNAKKNKLNTREDKIKCKLTLKRALILSFKLK